MMVELGRPARPVPASVADAPGPGTAPVTALDATAIAKLRDLDPTGAQGVLPRVLGAFEKSLIRLLDEVSVARAAGDHDRVARVAHTLKSSSASVGALALSRICAEVERCVRADGTPPSGQALDALVHEGQAAIVAVRAMLGR